jgi:hypothetical protein
MLSAKNRMKTIPLAVRLTLAFGILAAAPMAYAAATSAVGRSTAGPIAVLAGTGVTDGGAITLAADQSSPGADVVERPVPPNPVLTADPATTTWPLIAVIVGIALVLIVVSLIDTLASDRRVAAQGGW